MTVTQDSSQTAITLFGIPNCDTVKKARVWLAEQPYSVAFHDFKKQGLERASVEAWLTQIPLELLINRKGTTWRALSDEQKAQAEQRETAINLILSNTSLIKRPVLQIAEAKGKHMQYAVGFKPEQYQQLFSNVSP